MRKAPKKKNGSNKFIFPFVIILVLITVFAASFIIAYNVGMGGSAPVDTKTAEEYQQPEDMLNGKKTEDDKLAELRKENAELKRQVSDLEVENTELRNALNEMTATLENQNFVQQNGSSSSSGSSSTDTNDIDTSETGL